MEAEGSTRRCDSKQLFTAMLHSGTKTRRTPPGLAPLGAPAGCDVMCDVWGNLLRKNPESDDTEFGQGAVTQPVACLRVP